MNSKALEEKLRSVIRQTIEAMPDASPSELCRWTRIHHGALIGEFEGIWIDEKLTALYRSEFQRQHPMKGGKPRLGHPLQGRFPFPGYENIPVWISLEVGTRGKRARGKYLDDALLEDLYTRRSLVKGPLTAELPQLNKLIQLVERYDKAQPGITVGEALKLQAARKGRSKLG